MAGPGAKLRALSFGESVIDIYPDRRVVAGSPVHLAAHLAERGWSVSLATRLGDDPDAAAVREVVRRHGVSDELIEVDQRLPTGSVTIHFQEGGGHSFHIHKPAAWDELELAGELPEADVLCYGSLIGRSETSRAALFRLLADGRYPARLFDVNLRTPDIHIGTVKRALEAATILKVSDEELGALVDLLEVNVVDDFFAAAPDLEWLAMTRGAQGAELRHRSGRSWAKGTPALEVLDAVGAGDAFAAGLVDGLVRGRPGDEALTLALEAAESILGRRGGLPTG